MIWLLMAACVPRGRFEIVEVQLDATRTAMSARAAQCSADARAAEERLLLLDAEILARRTQLVELSAAEELSGGELERLGAERVALLAELAQVTAELAAANAALPKRIRKPAPEVPAPLTLLGRTVESITRDLQVHQEETLRAARVAEGQAEVAAAFDGLVKEGRAVIVNDGEDTRVVLATGLLFQEGFTTLSPRGQQIVAQAAGALQTIPGRLVTIEGHTDDRPVHTADFASNWDRGFSRALAVLRALEAARVPARLAVASLADTRPIVPNSTPEGQEQNRRVELRIALDPAVSSAFPVPEPQESPGPHAPHALEPEPEDVPDPVVPPAPSEVP